MKTELTRAMKYCTVMESDEFENSYDIVDVADDFPFASVMSNPSADAFGIGMSGNHWDVCRVDTCIEYGNEIRDDRYIARSCTLWAAIALCQALHLQYKPMLSPRAYLNPSKSAVEGITP